MKRIDFLRVFIRNGTDGDIARLIIKHCIINKYCKNDCENYDCEHEIECCIRWLNEDLGTGSE